MAKREVSSSATELTIWEFDSHELRYTYWVPKLHCTHRAEWRLAPGKPAERLSSHYQLGCDYGTALITIYREGDGIEPIYLCESHATEVGRSGDDGSRSRTITDQPDDSNSPAIIDDRTQAREVAHTGLKETASLEVAPSLADTKVGRVMTGASARAPVRDLTYGNPAKALVDETVWNLATGDYELYRAELQNGKTATEAAEAAGGQLAAVHRKIDGYTLKLQAILSESKATMEIGEVIDKPLEHATLEIIANSAMDDTEKDAAIQRLGALQEWIKRDLNREITPFEAHRIAVAIGDRVNWGGNAGIPEELKPAYRSLYSSVRNAIRAAVPESRDLGERLANLYAAKSDLQDEV